jgi:hypothetical protein
VVAFHCCHAGQRKLLLKASQGQPGKTELGSIKIAFVSIIFLQGMQGGSCEEVNARGVSARRVSARKGSARGVNTRRVSARRVS